MKGVFYGNKRKPQRNKRILELKEKGLGYKAIAKMYDLHFTRVKQIIRAETERVRERA